MGRREEGGGRRREGGGGTTNATIVSLPHAHHRHQLHALTRLRYPTHFGKMKAPLVSHGAVGSDGEATTVGVCTFKAFECQARVSTFYPAKCMRTCTLDYGQPSSGTTDDGVYGDFEVRAEWNFGFAAPLTAPSEICQLRVARAPSRARPAFPVLGGGRLRQGARRRPLHGRQVDGYQRPVVV